MTHSEASETPKASFPRSLFRRLFHKPQEPDQWLGLSKDQLETVQALLSHPGWTHYSALLDSLLALQAQPLLSGLLEHEKYLYQAGVVGALRRLQQLPDQLTAHLRTLNDRTKPRQPDTLHRFANTIWYDLAKRPN